MKPKIHLVHGRTASFVNEVVARHTPESNNDSSLSEASCGGKSAVLLESFLEVIIRAVGASAGTVRVLSPNGRHLSLIGCGGSKAEVCLNESVVDANCGVCGKSSSTGNIESSSAEFCMRRYGAAFFAEACSHLIAVPLAQGSNQVEPSGVITLFFASAQKVTDDIERTLNSYAQLMHIALTSAWQNEDDYQVSLLAERQSIANEIHDSLAQTLYFAKIRASLLLDALKTDNELLVYKCAQDIDEALESSQKTVRELVTHFRCQMDPQGLQYALQKLVKDFSARSGIAIDYSNQVGSFDLPAEYELQIFLIVREALVNIATHSGASLAGLDIACIDGCYQFTVEDNGGGMGNVVPPEGHYGLVIMRERALRIGGVVEVESLAGLGTRVQLKFNAP